MKVIKYIGLTLLLIVLGLSIYIFASGPKLSKTTKTLIDQVLVNELPEVIHGQTGYANSNGVKIWYELNKPDIESKGTILLIMGISSDALAWPLEFVNTLVDSGYDVIRYDHRGTGMSDWLEGWDNENPYSLADMADDGIAILDALHIERAHLVGVSLGGMVAQELTINHPERVASLSSMMSSGFIEDPNLPAISLATSLGLVKAILKYGLFQSESNEIKMRLTARQILKGEASYELNEKRIAETVLYNLRKRKGYNHHSSLQHQSAVHLSGSRYEGLSTLKTPTLIIHSKSDPLIPFEHGKKCFDLIPNADSLWLEGFGHDIPLSAIPIVTSKIINHVVNSQKLEELDLSLQNSTL